MQTNTHIGRLVREPQVAIRGEKNTKVAYVKLAINDLPKGQTTFIDYVAFNKVANLVEQYLTTKGQIVEVQFIMRHSQYTDSQSGEEVYKLQNVITHFRNYSPKPMVSAEEQNETESIETSEPENEINASIFNPLDYSFTED